MAGRLIGPWNPALDSSGDPISGSKLNTYMAGTTTNLATYPTPADADAGTNAHTNPVVADSAGRFAELWTPDGYSYDLKWTDAAGTQIELFEDIDALGAPEPGVTHRSYLAGLTMAPATANMTVAVGQATDAGNTSLINLAAALTKTTGAWAVGTNQGGLDTGSVAANTWYHWYVIERPDTGIVDACFSLNALAPTTGSRIASAYTLYRRIGSAKTDGSSHWLGFVQEGDTFTWTTPVVSVNNVSPPVSTGANTITIAVPTGVAMEAIFTASTSYVSGITTELRLYPAFATAVPVVADLYAPSTVPIAAGQFRLRTNASAQIVSNLTFGGVSTTYSIEVDGWIDRRGRDA